MCVADIHVRHSKLSGADIGGDLVLKAIDEFPVLCVASAMARGVTKISGAAELRVKESDRIASMSTELKKMDVHVEEFKDGLAIEGSEKIKSATVQSHGDHRIAMSMAIAGLTVEGETTVENTECVNTSFPGFTDLLDKLSVQ